MRSAATGFVWPYATAVSCPPALTSAFLAWVAGGRVAPGVHAVADGVHPAAAELSPVVMNQAVNELDAAPVPAPHPTAVAGEVVPDVAVDADHAGPAPPDVDARSGGAVVLLSAAVLIHMWKLQGVRSARPQVSQAPQKA